MRLAVAALGIGGGFVGAIELLGRNQLADPVPLFFLLLPGILTGALAPGWGSVSLVIVYSTNIAIYSGLAYGVLRAFRRSRKT